MCFVLTRDAVYIELTYVCPIQGGNSSFVLEEPPMPRVKAPDPRQFHVVAVSANTVTSLEQNKRRLLNFLTENPLTSLADLAYTTTARRLHHSLRSAYSGGSIQNIVDSLKRDLTRSTDQESSSAKPSRVVFLFTGQGAHYAGMGAELFKSSCSFRTTILALQRAATTHRFPSFINLISDPTTTIQDASIVQIHLALVALEIALVDLWKTWGVTPDVVIGHSIGEYAALYTAGVLSATDAIYLIGKRAMLVQNSCTQGTNGMLSISGTSEDVKAIFADESLGCEVACLNSSGMMVLSGEKPELQRVETLFKERNIKCRMLDVPYGMHSHQMEVILPGLREAAKGVQFRAPSSNIKVISTLLGTENTAFDSDYLVRHTREPVKFQQALSHCVDQDLVGVSALWLEIGPNPVCLGLARSSINSITSDHALPSLKKGDDDWKPVSAIAAACYKAGKPINWRAFHQDFTSNLSLINLPRYSFDTRNFWMTYTAPATSTKKNTDTQPISACLHHLVSQEDNSREQSATFKAIVSQPSLLEIIQGHKLSGITICPAGVFSEMALTAARYVLNRGSWSAPFPALSVLDTQIDHPIMPEPKNPSQAIQVSINRAKSSNEFTVSISDAAKPSVVNSKCRVTIRDEPSFESERHRLLEMVQPKVAKLQKAAAGGLANRFQGKLFYRLFANLMGYVDQYQGVQEAIVSSDFTEALASVRLPSVRNGVNAADQYTLSPYWIDALTHLAGFLFNGNPMSTGDDVYIGTHMERMEIVAKDFSPDVTYQSYACIEHPENSDIWRGHVYILDGDSVVGFLEGARFRKMPRHTLHRILGKVDPLKQTKETSSSATNGTEGAVNGTNGAHGINGSNGHVSVMPAPNASGVNGDRNNKSLYTELIAQLVDETGMEASELTSSTYFAEIGVDSLMSISVLAALKAETGVELNASFLIDHPTLGDAERELRLMERKNESGVPDVSSPAPAMNGNGTITEELPNCNVVLMQGASTFGESNPPFFLIADGAGSAAAYIHFPKLGRDLSVFAVESPWVNDPQNFTCSFEQAASQYLAAIRAKQPRGPYILGGWSAGGVFAYEVARLLLEAGEKVLGLVIIDITGPRAEDRSKVTPPTMDIIDQIGMLSGIERNFDDTAPQSVRLKQHMLSTVTCFSNLDPIAMSPGRQPGFTHVIWAKKDILPKEAVGSLPPGLDAWFYPASHPDAAPYGWDVLVGEKLKISRIEGDHFSIMTAPEASYSTDIIIINIDQFIGYGSGQGRARCCSAKLSDD